MMNIRIICLYVAVLFLACESDEEIPEEEFVLLSAKIGALELQPNITIENTPVDLPILLRLNKAVDTATASVALQLTRDDTPIPFSLSYLDNNQTISLRPVDVLDNKTTYSLIVNELKSASQQSLSTEPFRFETVVEIFSATSVLVSGQDLTTASRVQEISISPQIEVVFEKPLSASMSFEDLVYLENSQGIPWDLSFQLDQSGTQLTIQVLQDLDHISRYEFSISDTLSSISNAVFEGFTGAFYTEIDQEFKFPLVSSDELLTKIQEQTFQYFWDFGHPVSGMARERNTSGDLVTSGGSGFALMAILVGIQRGFITREQGLERITTMIDFLDTADRFHGAWSHWLNGQTGTVIPFSTLDNGGDLVETSYLIQGLLTVRQYLDPVDTDENELIGKINELWEAVEWDWYTQGGQDQLYWHYSDEFQWQINLPVRGYNEALITYVLAASSPTHAITPSVYHQGWARNGDIRNGNTYFNINLPLGPPQGGPLFFTHYSFLGLDPRNLEDDYANYWTQNINHSQINYQYCIANPNGYVGYDSGCWGLTASDNQNGYSAHSPNNDLGVITPTAAISSLPYTPTESMQAMEHFYYILGDKLWGTYGFYDAFNLTAEWVADSYLAIDQGPIIIMIENHRTGLLWDLFMSAPEVQSGLQNLNFTF